MYKDAACSKVANQRAIFSISIQSFLLFKSPLEMCQVACFFAISLFLFSAYNTFDIRYFHHIIKRFEMKLTPRIFVLVLFCVAGEVLARQNPNRE